MKKRIGEILVERGYLTEEQLSKALNYQIDNNMQLGEILLHLGFIREESLNENLNIQKNSMKDVSLMIYAGTKEQYLLLEQIFKYFVNTFNIEPADCLVQILIIIQSVFRKKNISISDFTTIPGDEQRAILNELVGTIIGYYNLQDDEGKILLECKRLYKDWEDDFIE